MRGQELMIGRKKETAALLRLYNSRKAELVAVYGRRRVGKTYLIDETFGPRITFRHAGLSPVEAKGAGLLSDQLEQFYYSLAFAGMRKGKKPKSWLEAFYQLECFLTEIDDGSRQLVFIDELPWLDTPRSRFITAFEGFWNNWGCHRKNLMVIVAGSANSWILDKLINNHGGLYGRVTYEIKLNPFTLNESEEYLNSNDIRFSRYDVVQSYMMLGGIPYYLGYLQRGMSLAQSIDDVFFSENAKLKDEYDRLFASVFDNPDFMKKIISFLYTKNAGYTRKELADHLKIKDGGVFTEQLRALLASGFIVRYIPFGYKKSEAHYKLTDPFCMFFLRFVRDQSSLNKDFWQNNTGNQSVITWRGFAFESICFLHIKQIKDALGIRGVSSTESAWSKRPDDQSGTQIDLLISREDNVINMCEIKFLNRPFTVNKAYYNTLMQRESILSEKISPKLRIHSTLITTYGLECNEYNSAFANVVTLDDLFKP